MKTKLAYGILAASLVAIPSYGEGEEGEGQETQTPEPFTATVVPGGTKSYTNPEHWKTGAVPNGYHVDVRLDGDPEVATRLNFSTSAEKTLVATNGVVNIDEGDTLYIYTTYNNNNADLSLWTSCITNQGSITFGNVKKNGGSFWLHAYDSNREVNYPSYNGRTGVITIQTMNAQGCTHRMYWLLDGSVNDGTIIINSLGAQYQYANLNLEGGGTFTNNGTITISAEGTYSANKPGSSDLGLYGGDSVLTGTGTVRLDCSKRPATGTQNPWLKFAGLNNTFTQEAGHSIVGEGILDNGTIINRGLIKSEGEVRSLEIHMQDYRNATFYASAQERDVMSMTNDVTGRIVAASASGINFSYSSRPNRNTRFINLGLLEARTGSKISFAGGVNTSTASIPDGDLNDYDGAYLELWGRVAGGGEFVTRRRIYIGDGAVLAPGDLANDNGTGDSTCGTITFPRLVLRGPAAIADSEETTSGAITEFQCRKPVAGKYDSVWVNGDATVAGTLKFLENPSSGTYPIFTSTGTLTCDLKTLKVECSQGVKAPKLKLVESTYPVTEEVGVVDGEGNPVMDAESGLQVTETKTVDYPCQRIEATWMNGFTITLR